MREAKASYVEIRIHAHEIRDSTSPLTESDLQNSTCPHAFLHYLYSEQESNKNIVFLISLLNAQNYETQGSAYTVDTAFTVDSETTFSILHLQTGQVV